MHQPRPKFIAAFFIFISFLFSAVYAHTGALNHHPRAGNRLGSYPSGGIGHARQNQNANVNHHPGLRGIGNVHRNQQQEQTGINSGGIENSSQNQSQQLPVKHVGIPHESYGISYSRKRLSQMRKRKSTINGRTRKNRDHQRFRLRRRNIFHHGMGLWRPIVPSALAQEFLLAHNMVRKMFNEPPYTWDHELASYAENHVKKISYECKMIHSDGAYGENIFWGLNWHWTATDAVKCWFEEYKYYDFKKRACAMGKTCGHFTQMVWRDSVHLGCAVSYCHPGTGMLIICEYDPPGNYENENPLENNNGEK